MAKSKKSKPSVKVRDMKAKKDPKGGATVDYFLKVDSSLTSPTLTSPTLTSPTTTTISSTDLLKLHK